MSSVFLSTVLTEKKKRYRPKKPTRTRIISSLEKVCCICNNKIRNEADISIEHFPPAIIILAGAKTRSYYLAHINCNTCDSIPNCLGILFKSNNLLSIQYASRHLCNLVRPVKKPHQNG